MAITRTDIAKQLLANGGRTGFQRGGRRGDTGQASQGVSDSFGGPPGGGATQFGSGRDFTTSLTRDRIQTACKPANER